MNLRNKISTPKSEENLQVVLHKDVIISCHRRFWSRTKLFRVDLKKSWCSQQVLFGQKVQHNTSRSAQFYWHKKELHILFLAEKLSEIKKVKIDSNVMKELSFHYRKIMSNRNSEQQEIGAVNEALKIEFYISAYQCQINPFSSGYDNDGRNQRILHAQLIETSGFLSS